MSREGSHLLRPAGPSQEDNAPVNVDAILLSILGKGGERFGIAAAVLRGERIIAQGGAGVRKRGSAERITLDDRFHLGSCTKAMTATLVAMLVEEGKLNWTTTLGELFADTVKPLHPAWEKVTLRQVLAHRAGLPLEPDGLNPVIGLLRELMRPPRTLPGTLPQQRLEIARQALSRPPGIPPDTKFYYSNVGYVLAGAVLEQLTGRAWEELMCERLFQPLGISTGGFGAPATADKTDQAWGHSPVLGKLLDPRKPRRGTPAVLRARGPGTHDGYRLGKIYRAPFAGRSGQPALPGRAAQAGYICGNARGRTHHTLFQGVGNARGNLPGNG
jgi:CubicO group peptidase (beta-lactamase class C family)